MTSSRSGSSRNNKGIRSVGILTESLVAVVIGGVLVYFGEFMYSIAFFFVGSLGLVSALCYLVPDVRRALYDRRRSRLRRVVVVVDGSPLVALPKKPKNQTPLGVPDDLPVVSYQGATTKGAVMKDLGLNYKHWTPSEHTEPLDSNPAVRHNAKKTRESRGSSGIPKTVRDLFKVVEDHGHVRISWQAHVGQWRGKEVGGMLLSFAPKYGIDIKVRKKGKDIIIEKIK